MTKKIFTEFLKSNKKGGSIIAVLSTLSIAAIFILCASGIALANYRTAKNVTSLDARYYSAEASQTQIMSVIQEKATVLAAEWDYDNSKYSTFFTTIYNAANDFAISNKDTLYNSEYTVTTEISQPAADYSDFSYTFEITSAVTSENSKVTKEYQSQITVNAPHKKVTSTPKYITVVEPYQHIIVKNIFNNCYALVCNGSDKNTDWYGLWGGFNTYYTYNESKTSPLIGNTNDDGIFKGVSNSSQFSNFLVTEDNPGTASGVYLKLCNDKEKYVANSSEKASSFNYVSLFSLQTSVDNVGASQAIKVFMDNFKVEINRLIYAVDETSEYYDSLRCNNADEEFTMWDWGNGQNWIPKGLGYFGITLDIAGSKTDNGWEPSTKESKGWVNSAKEKFYVKYLNGSKDTYVLTFKRKPGDNDSDEYCKPTDITITGPSCRIFKTGSNYKYEQNKSFNQDSTKTYSNTYPDHYYKNKWFFIDLGGNKTFYIDNSTSTNTFLTTTDSTKWYTPLFTETFTDEWENVCNISKGNIVLENCYFFVNGNIRIGNAFNMSDCKFFATGDITLDYVHYPEGLLSLETTRESNKGSYTIQQSFYYCEGIFTSNLVSRYASNFIVKKDVSDIGLEDYDDYIFYSSNSTQTNTTNNVFESKYLKYCIPNGNTFCYDDETYIAEKMHTFDVQYTGYLAVHHHSTVLKATIIAKGEKKINVDTTLSDNKGSYVKSNTDVSGVSVFLNPKHGTGNYADCILIEGQIFAKGKVYTANYNWFDKNVPGTIKGTNRYAASSQLEYHAYHYTTDVEKIVSVINAGTVEGLASQTRVVSWGENKSYEEKPLEITSTGLYAKSTGK